MRFLIYSLTAILRKSAILFYTFINQAKLRLMGAKLGKNIIFSGFINLVLHWTAQLKIGDNCRINSGFLINPVGGYRKTGLYIGRDAILNIGASVGISNVTIVCLKRIEIQDKVYIGGGSEVYDTDFHSLDDALRGTQFDKPAMAPVVLEEGCFVGGHSIILKGVRVGRGAVIGAGSVVTKSVPAFEVWAGNPARFIRNLR